MDSMTWNAYHVNSNGAFFEIAYNYKLFICSDKYCRNIIYDQDDRYEFTRFGWCIFEGPSVKNVFFLRNWMFL